MLALSQRALADLVPLDFENATVTDAGGAASMNDLSLTNPVTATFGSGSVFEGLEVVVSASADFNNPVLYNSASGGFTNPMLEGNTNLFSFDFNKAVDLGVFIATNQINNAVSGDTDADELYTLTLIGGAWDPESFTWYGGANLTPGSGVVIQPSMPLPPSSVFKIGTRDTPEFLENDTSNPITFNRTTAQAWFVEGNGTGFDFQYELDDSNGQDSFKIYVDTDSVSSIPEQSPLSLIWLAVLGMLAQRRR